MQKLILSLFVLVLSIGVFGQSKYKTAKKKSSQMIDYSKTYENEWTYFESSSDRRFYYNAGRATQQGSIVKIWTEAGDKKDGEVISKDLFEINCASQKYRTLAGVMYFTFTEYVDGRKEKRRIDPDSFDTPDSKFTVIIPDSITEALAEAVCKL